MIGWRNFGIRFRLALLYSAIFAVGLSIFCFFLYQSFEKAQIQAFDATLFNFAVDVSSNLEIDFVGGLVVNVNEEGKVLPFHLGKSVLEIRDAEGHLLVHLPTLRGASLPFDPQEIRELSRTRASFRTIQSAGNELRLLTYWASRSDWMKPLIIQIAVPLDLPRRERQNLLLFFVLAIPLVLVAAAVAGVLMSRWTLLPVKEITDTVRKMGAGSQMSERVPVPAPQDEIRELAETFNSLLGRLEKVFDSQDRFISNASHQLKTPLTILKGELNLAKKADAAGVQEFFGSASAEIEHMIHLVEDLLMLARLEAGSETLQLRPIALDEVVLSVVSRIQKIAREKGVQINTSFRSEASDQEFDAQVQGDEELLSCLFENLIENAVKYSPDSSVVDVQLQSGKDGVELIVADEGPGMGKENQPKIFERFQRGYPSSFIPGSGLGLAIVSEIAQLHGIRINVAENAERGHGTRVGVLFPISEA